MTIVSSVAGWAAFGWAVRMYALGLQKRPLLDGIGAHFATAGAFGGIGYGVYLIQKRQSEQVHAKKQALLERRAQHEAAES